MADHPSPSVPPESGRSTGGADGASAQTTIFLTDPSAEAERAAQALRSAGYHVVDVPLSLLVARVSVQRPAMILLDVDADGALDVVKRFREVAGTSQIEVLFFGEAQQTVKDLEGAITAGASGFFARPLDIGAVTRKVGSLAPLHSEPLDEAGLTPPPSFPSSRARGPSSSDQGPDPHLSAPPLPESIAPQIQLAMASLDSAPLSSSAPPGPHSSPPVPPSMAPSSLLEGTLDPSAWGGPQSNASIASSLSEELQRVLASAEERIGASLHVSSQPPSPEEEVDAVLPADLLAALDDQVGFEEEPAEGSGNVWNAGSTPSRTSTTGGGRVATAAGTHAGASPGTGAGTGVGLGPGTGVGPTHSGSHAGTSGGGQAAHPLPSFDDIDEPAEARRGSLPSTSPDAPTPLPPRSRRPGSATPPPPSIQDEEPVTPRPPRGRTAYDAPPPPELEETRSLPGPGTGVDWTSRREPVSTHDGRTPLPRRDSVAPPTTAQRVEPAAPPAVQPSSVALTEGESLRLLARGAEGRYTGCLCFDDGQGLRRVVLRDGDLITASSSFEDETLVAFLGARGELSKEVAKRLVGRLAPFGRHAGAALIAHGHLAQDRLWEVLRSHAEWIVGRVVLLERGACIYEGEPPGRLRAEPSVFGGSTGAEVIVEVVRRIVPPATAIQRLGGSRARLGDGRRRQLLSECALSEREGEIVQRAPGSTVGEIVDSTKTPEIASVLLALTALGVLEVLAPAEGRSQSPPPPVDPLDEEALRARVRARLDLVEEGDYFAVLGVPLAATPYEIRRAYLDLRRSFDPTRVLTGGTADLVDSVQTILEVLDEAYEILRDPTRRERYRRAISAAPVRP